MFDPGGSTAVVAGADVEAEAPPGPVEITFTAAGRLLLPISEGEEIGTVDVVSGDSVLGSAPALAANAVSVHEPSWGERALAGLLRTAAIVAGGIGA